MNGYQLNKTSLAILAFPEQVAVTEVIGNFNGTLAQFVDYVIALGGTVTARTQQQITTDLWRIAGYEIVLPAGMLFSGYINFMPAPAANVALPANFGVSTGRYYLTHWDYGLVLPGGVAVGDGKARGVIAMPAVTGYLNTRSSANGTWNNVITSQEGPFSHFIAFASIAGPMYLDTSVPPSVMKTLNHTASLNGTLMIGRRAASEK